MPLVALPRSVSRWDFSARNSDWRLQRRVTLSVRVPIISRCHQCLMLCRPLSRLGILPLLFGDSDRQFEVVQ